MQTQRLAADLGLEAGPLTLIESLLTGVAHTISYMASSPALPLSK